MIISKVITSKIIIKITFIYEVGTVIKRVVLIMKKIPSLKYHIYIHPHNYEFYHNYIFTNNYINYLNSIFKFYTMIKKKFE